MSEWQFLLCEDEKNGMSFQKNDGISIGIDPGHVATP